MVAITPRPASLTSLIDLPPHPSPPPLQNLSPLLCLRLTLSRADVWSACCTWNLLLITYVGACGSYLPCVMSSTIIFIHAVLPLPLPISLSLALSPSLSVCEFTDATANRWHCSSVFPPPELSVVLKVSLLLQKRRKTEKTSGI